MGTMTPRMQLAVAAASGRARALPAAARTPDGTTIATCHDGTTIAAARVGTSFAAWPEESPP